MKKYLIFVLALVSFAVRGQKTIVENFVRSYYEAYSNVPTAARLAPFYAEGVVLDDPTYDFIGRSKEAIFRNFDGSNVNNHYTWRIDQQISKGDTIVVEGLLKAKYAGTPYGMRFVNIFHLKDGKIIRQYDYFDNKDWYKVVEAHHRPKDEAVLRKLKEEEWPRAYREQDTVLLDRILAEEFQLIDSRGNVYSKRDELSYIKANRPSYASFQFKIDRLEIFENNTAIVSGTGTIHDKDKDGPYRFTYKSTNVLIKRNGIWKAISSHTSGDTTVRE